MDPGDEWEKWIKIGLIIILSYFVCVLMPQVIFKVWL